MPTIEQTIACQELVFETHEGHTRFFDQATNEPFDATSYSRLKYGSLKQAQAMGRMVGEALLARAPEVVLDETPPEAVVAYRTVPPACHALSRFCLEVVNERRQAQGLAPGEVVQIYKPGLYTVDYATTSLEERAKLSHGASSHDTMGHDYHDKPVIFLDDVRITGTTERKIHSTLMPHQPRVLLNAYRARFNEAAASQEPGIEGKLNSTYVQSLTEVGEIVREDGFVLNIRVLKRMILAAEQLPKLEGFLADLPDNTLYAIYEGCMRSGAEFLQPYLPSFKKIAAAVNERDLPLTVL